MRKTAIAAVSLALALATPLAAQPAKPAPAKAQATKVQAAKAAPSLDGDWEGTLMTPQGMGLRLAMHFETKDKVQKGQMISVDQNNATVPIDSILITGNEVSLSMAKIHGSYEGKFSADGKTLNGTWSQGPASLPLSLARKGK